MDIVDLDHLVLTVRDVAATVAFYERVLGFVAETDARGRNRLRFGQKTINLHQAGAEFEPKAARPVPGSADLCFTTAGPIGAVLARLGETGTALVLGPVARVGARGPMTSVYFRDPDGALLEVASYEPFLSESSSS